MAEPDRDKFRSILQRRVREQDRAVNRFEKNLEELSENIGRRLAASLGVDPDTVAERRKSDGRLVGQTDFEQRIQASVGIERIRANVLLASAQELVSFVDASGLERTRPILTSSFEKLAGLAEAQAAAAGLAAAGVLDTAAATALLGSFVEGRLNQDFIGGLGRVSANRIRAGLISNLGIIPMQEVAARIAEAELVSVPVAVTEARTRMAEADRFAGDVVRQSVDPDGEATLLVYQGPDDGITRDFCRILVNKAFTVDDFDAANNHQTATHPRYAGGGYNCRHAVSIMPNSPAALEALGIQLGDAADVQAASNAAKAKRKKRKKR